MESDIIGIWKSSLLKTIPDYQSNFGNWIYCENRIGRIMLVINNIVSEAIEVQIHVPVLFPGGKGFYHLNTYIVDFEEERFLYKSNSSFATNYKLFNAILRLDGLFESAFLFVRVSNDSSDDILSFISDE